MLPGNQGKVLCLNDWTFDPALWKGLNVLRDPLSQKRQFSLKEVIIDFTPPPVVPVGCMETQKPEMPDRHKQRLILSVNLPPSNNRQSNSSKDVSAVG